VNSAKEARFELVSSEVLEKQFEPGPFYYKRVLGDGDTEKQKTSSKHISSMRKSSIASNSKDYMKIQ